MGSLEPLVISVVFGLVGAFIAHRKNRNRLIWFLLSAIFFLPILVVLLLPKISSEETNEEGGLSEAKKPFPIGKIVSGTLIVVFAIIYVFLLEDKKEATAVQTKNDFISTCNSDPVCLEKIEKNFDSCIKEHLTIEKTGKKSRDIKLDMEQLKTCVGV